MEVVVSYDVEDLQEEVEDLRHQVERLKGILAWALPHLCLKMPADNEPVPTYFGGRASLDDTELLEELAALAHEQWSGWMRYMLPKLEEVIGLGFYEARDEGLDTEGLREAQTCLERWRYQMKTPYSDLPEHSKESDRKEARRVLEVIAAHLTAQGRMEKSDE